MVYLVPSYLVLTSTCEFARTMNNQLNHHDACAIECSQPFLQ